MNTVLMVSVLIQHLAARNGVEMGDHSKAYDTLIADYKCAMPVFGPHYLDPGTVLLYMSLLCEHGPVFTSCVFSCYLIESPTANQLPQVIYVVNFH